MSIHNILPQQFHTLSQQNTRLNQTLITVTLNHEHLLQENRQLSEELKKKDYALIEATLREKNLDHSLKNVQVQYTKLQEQYQEIYNIVKTSRKLQLRDIYKKESQLAFDMVNIERESYREAKRAKNEQINQYQQRILELARENDQLKVKILEMTSDYNTKLYEVKSANIQNETKLNALKSLQAKQKPQVVFGSTNSFEVLKLELKLQNTKEKLEFFVKENNQIKTRNIELNAQVQRLLVELNQATEDSENTKSESNKQGELWKVLNKEDSSVEYITKMLQENTKLRKEIQETTQKYILLTERFPKLIDEFQIITQLQENINKLNQVKSLQTKLSESQHKCKSLQQSLQKLQAKLLGEFKSRQTLQHKNSILTKRFNEIFIRMNPYFDIYQYESLELDETMFKFFDEKKDYKSLKEYEGKVLGLKRELKEAQANFEAKQRQLKLQIQEKGREIMRINQEKQQTLKNMNELSDANKVLKQQLSNYQLLINSKIQQQPNPSNSNQAFPLTKLQHEVTIPLLQQLINNLHLERQELFKAIYNKDKTIAELSQELHSAKLNQTIKTINISQEESPNKLIEMPSVSVQFSELLKHNHELEKKYDQTVEKMQTELKTLKQQLNNQHNLYQLQVNKYENEYQTKLAQMKRMLDNWMASSEQLRIKLQSNQQPQKHNQKEDRQNIRVQGEQQGQMIQQQPLPANPSQQMNPNPKHIQQANPLIRHPSHSNLQKLPLLHQQTNNKLIGESTVQTLTQTLKKYQQDMNEVLSMCAKVSKDYSELKERVKGYEQLEKNNIDLINQMAHVKLQLEKTKGYLNEKNLAITTLQTLYKAKSSYCDQLQSTTQSSQNLLNAQLAQQYNLNQTLTKQLQQLKEKFYQLASKPSSSSAQDASLMNKGEFQTIVIMQANKNKEISNLAEKNKLLETKLHGLMQEMNQMKLKETEKKALEVSPMERAEMKQLSELLQGTNVIELVKRANQIIEQQTQKDRQMAQEQQHEQGPGNEGLNEEPKEGEHIEA